MARRAAAVNGECLHKVRELDERYALSVVGQVGPVEHKLRSLGEVRGLVFGSWAEASPHVNWLLSQAVESGCICHRSAASYAVEDDARAVLTRLLRRRWGMAALRANAKLLLDRLAYVGRGAAAAASRRAAALGRARCLAKWGRQQPCVWGVGH